jgi:hypothetical protein
MLFMEIKSFQRNKSGFFIFKAFKSKRPRKIEPSVFPIEVLNPETFVRILPSAIGIQKFPAERIQHMKIAATTTSFKINSTSHLIGYNVSVVKNLIMMEGS